MFINAIELPNPVMFTVSQAYIAHQNLVLSGYQMTKILRTPTEGGSAYAQLRYLLRFQFEDLTISDYDLFETAWSDLVFDYCTLKLAGLGINLTTYPGGSTLTDAVWVTAAPNFAPSYEVVQGTAKGQNGAWEGPYLYKATWSVLSGDMRYSEIG